MWFFQEFSSTINHSWLTSQSACIDLMAHNLWWLSERKLLNCQFLIIDNVLMIYLKIWMIIWQPICSLVSSFTVLFCSVKQTSWKGWQLGEPRHTASLKMTTTVKASRLSVITGSGFENNKKSRLWWKNMTVKSNLKK